MKIIKRYFNLTGCKGLQMNFKNNSGYLNERFNHQLTLLSNYWCMNKLMSMNAHG